MAKEITLSNGMITLVSPEDFERASKYRWTASPANQYRGYRHNPKWYACRWEAVSGAFVTVKSGPNKGKKRTKQQKIYLHRWLCDAPPGFVVDHGDGNSLNNQRENLVIATYQENALNRQVETVDW